MMNASEKALWIKQVREWREECRAAALNGECPRYKGCLAGSCISYCRQPLSKQPGGDMWCDEKHVNHYCKTQRCSPFCWWESDIDCPVYKKMRLATEWRKRPLEELQAGRVAEIIREPAPHKIGYHTQLLIDDYEAKKDPCGPAADRVVERAHELAREIRG